MCVMTAALQAVAVLVPDPAVCVCLQCHCKARGRLLAVQGQPGIVSKIKIGQELGADNHTKAHKTLLNEPGTISRA